MEKHCGSQWTGLCDGLGSKQKVREWRERFLRFSPRNAQEDGEKHTGRT